MKNYVDIIKKLHFNYNKLSVTLSCMKWAVVRYYHNDNMTVTQVTLFLYWTTEHST